MKAGLDILNNRMHVTSAILISNIGATIQRSLLVSLYVTTTSLHLCPPVWHFGSGFTSTYTSGIKEIQQKSPSAETSTIFWLLAARQGFDAVCSGPISEALLGEQPRKRMAVLWYNTGHEGLNCISWVTAFRGGLGFVARRSEGYLRLLDEQRSTY